MADPSKRNLKKQHSLSYVEQSLNLMPPPHQGPITIYPGPKNKMANLSKADLEIANRLERLRRSSQEIPSEEEMASRLAILKGLPADHYTKPRNTHPPPDNRTQLQQTDDLISQIMEEVSIESKAHKYSDEELEERLEKVKDDDSKLRPYSSSAVPMGLQMPTPMSHVPPPPEGHYPQHHGASAIGMEHLSISDANALIREAEKENLEAKRALDAAKYDKDRRTSKSKGMRHKHKLKKEQKKQKKERDRELDPEKKKKRKIFKRDKGVKAAAGEEGAENSSSAEYVSDSDLSDSDPEAKASRSKKATQKEKEEVDRIVKMYTSPYSDHKKHKDDDESSEDSEEDSDSDSEYTEDSSDDEHLATH